MFLYYVVVLSPVFHVEVRVAGLQRVSQERLRGDIESAVFGAAISSFLGIHNYFSWPREIATSDATLVKLTVHKNWLEKRITIAVEERKPYGIWCVQESGQCFWFDESGLLFEPAPHTEGHLLLKITSDADAAPPFVGTQIPEAWLALMKKIIVSVKTIGIPAKDYRTLHALHEFYFNTERGTELRFSLRFDPESSLSALQSLYEKSGLADAAYIDFTVENRVYIKSR